MFIISMVFCLPAKSQTKIDAKEILDKIDSNMYSATIEYDGKMIIKRKGRTSTKTYHAYAEGTTHSFAKYFSPSKDAGTKFLKIKDNLWIYLPSVEKSTRISGHMLRRSMMGSDFSYEDALEQSKLLEKYDASVEGEETVNDREAYILDLVANTKKVTYYRRKIWVDKKRFIVVKAERYSKSGKLLKVMNSHKVEKFGSRWYLTHLSMEDKLRKNSRTELIVTNPVFNKNLPSNIFSLEHLERQ